MEHNHCQFTVQSMVVPLSCSRFLLSSMDLETYFPWIIATRPTATQTNEPEVESLPDTWSCPALSAHLCSSLTISGEAGLTPLGVYDAYLKRTVILIAKLVAKGSKLYHWSCAHTPGVSLWDDRLGWAGDICIQQSEENQWEHSGPWCWPTGVNGAVIAPSTTKNA